MPTESEPLSFSFFCRFLTPWSSFLIKDRQVIGWRVNIGVRARISMGGMNYSTPAPLIYFTSARERQGKKMEMQGKVGAGILVYFYFHWASPLKLWAKFSTKYHYSALFHTSRGPLADLINITEEYFPLPVKQDFSILRVSAKQMAWAGSVCCSVGASTVGRSSWCSQAGENRKLPHSGRAMMDAHCRATAAWPPYKLRHG